MGFNKCIISCIHNYIIIQNHFTALKIPYVPTSGNHWSLYCLKSFAFPQNVIIGIIQYVALSDLLLSLIDNAFKVPTCLSVAG